MCMCVHTCTCTHMWNVSVLMYVYLVLVPFIECYDFVVVVGNVQRCELIMLSWQCAIQQLLLLKRYILYQNNTVLQAH